jgi:signal transduction histidine kinase
LKNLLQPLVTGTEFLREELDQVFRRLPQKAGEPPDESKGLCEEVINMVQSTSRRIQDRVKQIADCVKGLSTPPQFKPCQVAAVVEGVLKTLRLSADSKGVVLRAEGLDSLPQILADEQRLFNALYNLVNNAIPEVPRGGSITVQGRADRPGGFLVLSVTDTGRGMPPDILGSLFSVRAISRKPGGTGLGTKIVKDVVDAHRGQITVDSQEGRGTTFTLRLPLDPSKQEPALR